MANEREQNQPETGNAEDEGRSRYVQFNELTELSLEERMKVADQMGTPASSVNDAAALGAAIVDDEAGGSRDGQKGESTGEETDR